VFDIFAAVIFPPVSSAPSLYSLLARNLKESGEFFAAIKEGKSSSASVIIATLYYPLAFSVSFSTC